MKRIISVFGVFWIILSANLPLVAGPKVAPEDNFSAHLQVIREYYNAALSHAESMAIQTQRLEQSQERLQQAKTTEGPKLNFISSYIRQDDRDTKIEPNQFNTRFNITQPIFHGFREQSQIDSATADVKVQEALQGQERSALFIRVSQAYLGIVTALNDIKNFQALRKLNGQRIKDIAARVRIGRSRQADLLSVQAQDILVGNQLQAAQGQFDTGWTELTYLTGMPKRTFTDLDVNILNAQPPVEQLQIGLSQRSDLVALEKQVDAARSSVESLRSGRYPSLDLAGNYYIQRTGALEPVKWDIGISLNYPIYEGGLVRSQVSEGLGKVRERELLYSQAKRQGEVTLTNNYVSLKNLQQQRDILAKALLLLEKNYQEQTRDYSLSLVTSLEVLQALNTLEETRRNLDHLNVQIMQTLISLNTTAGILP